MSFPCSITCSFHFTGSRTHRTVDSAFWHLNRRYSPPKVSTHTYIIHIVHLVHVHQMLYTVSTRTVRTCTACTLRKTLYIQFTSVLFKIAYSAYSSLQSNESSLDCFCTAVSSQDILRRMELARAKYLPSCWWSLRMQKMKVLRWRWRKEIGQKEEQIRS